MRVISALDNIYHTAAPTPGQIAAEKWLRDHPDQEMREVQPGDLDRLTREHENNPDPRDRDFGVPTGGGGHVPQSYEDYGSGYNTADRSYPDDGDSGVWHRGGDRPLYWEDSGHHDNGTGEYSDDLYSDDEEREPAHYHVVTGPVGSHDPAEWTEHPYTMFEHPDSDYDTGAAWDYFQQDHPQYNAERNLDATHEVKHVHPAENHEAWRNDMRSEDEDFSKISQHGLQREAPNIPGHRAYTHTDPHGGTHRLWHNETTFHVGDGTGNVNTHGPGWRTSYHDPDLRQEQQVPWTYHGDPNTPGGIDAPLDAALARIERNKIHADVMHSDTGLKPVENAYGHHYVSRRRDGSIQQLFRNYGHADEPNWGVTHYPKHTQDPDDDRPWPSSTTEHGADLQGALEQARRNMARG